MIDGHRERRFVIPPPSMDITKTTILMSIKRRDRSEATTYGKERCSTEGPSSEKHPPLVAQDIGTPSKQKKSVQALISSEEDIFEDMPEIWSGQEEQLVEINKEKMTILLEDIDHLVDKECYASASSDEDKRECERDVHALEGCLIPLPSL